MIRKYPKHFYEKERIEIAVSQIQHDLRKLLPDIDPKEWKKIDLNISGWFDGKKYELEPVHDFWNFFGGFARGLKLKSLLFWITADNVKWSKKEVPLAEIVITWDYPTFSGFMGKAPYSASEVISFLNKPKNAGNLEEQKKNSDMHSYKYPERDNFPIVVFFDARGGVIDKPPGYYILEGNRRVARSIVYNKKTITAFVGELNQNEVWPENFWFRTGVLRDLIFLAIAYEKEKDDLAFRVVRDFYQLLLRDFENVRITTIDKSFKNFEKSKRLLEEIMLEDLK
ncbi:MAG: hypothetical protein WC107_01770 [Patescibacteria group bacterium]